MRSADPDTINAETKPELGYETRDIQAPLLYKSVFWFLAISTAMIFITIPIWVFIMSQKDGFDPARTAPLQLPSQPNPLLQSERTAKLDIKTLRQQEEAHLGSFGWVDRGKGIARIPIDRAIELVAQRGLPSGSPAQAPSEATP
jgi:hypothetical protein